MLDKKRKKEEGKKGEHYILDNKRLRDAVARKNVEGVREAIYKGDYRDIKAHQFYINGRINEEESQNNFNKKELEYLDLSVKNGNTPYKDTGFFHLNRKRFDDTYHKLNFLKKFLGRSLIASGIFVLINMFLALTAISKSASKEINGYLMIIGMFILFIVFVLFGILIYKSLFLETSHERIKKQECERIDDEINNEIEVIRSQIDDPNIKLYRFYGES